MFCGICRQFAKHRCPHRHSGDTLNHDPLQITGCVLSSLLTATCEEIKPTLGKVNSDDALANYRKLVQLGFDAADLHCGEYVVADELISKFRQQFGGRAGG